jgi:predicted  nucleic acid-binding Zn-ribbon protein
MSLELELAAARQETELARQEMLAANASGEELATARTRIAELEGETMLTRSALDEASRRIESLEQAALAAAGVEAELQAATERVQALERAAMTAGSAEAELHQMQAELQQTQAQLASTTENLRVAYERLHQFEIAQALQQHQQARTASPFAWQS